MVIKNTDIKDACIIEIDKKEDDRGFFSRAWCAKEFRAHGLNTNLVQANVSFSRKRGTLRGMHYQVAPHEEVKLVRCTQGSICDVIIDLRKESSTYEQWVAVELTADNHRMLYVPEGCAHGFQSLEDDTEVFYLVSEFYSVEAERGVRWDDPAFGVRWPIDVTNISDKDKSWPDFAA
ncbi:MAG: dTDP-4-dehydrorhamnose 3,5-epimerase [Verrucomicrobia bacterium]|nr:dTDP-4-dehydrorhamnose 3,5-epimerase [Verrucomicrobiota bacterium]